MEEYNYTSTHPLGHTGPVTGSLYIFTAYVKRMRTTVPESGVRNFESLYELKRISNNISFSGYFHASIKGL